MPVEHLSFPYDNGTFDVALLSSVYTHMCQSGIKRYVHELGRVLRPGGRCLVSAMLMNEATKTAVQAEMTLFNFVHRLGQWNWTFDPDTRRKASQTISSGSAKFSLVMAFRSRRSSTVTGARFGAIRFSMIGLRSADC